MDIRAVGQPITASQRRSYSQTPDSSFYQTFQSAFAAAGGRVADSASGASAAGPTSAEALEAILGRTHVELSALRGVDSDSQARYAQVLDEAYGSGAMGNARQFLGSLSAEELEAVRRNHCLADPIDVVFFHFPGGDVEQNITRWKNQLSGTAESKTEEIEAGGKKITIFQGTGTYTDPFAGKGAQENYALIGALIPMDDSGPVVIKAAGPKAAALGLIDALKKLASSPFAKK